MYGKRQVGKTTLLQEFSKKTNSIFYLTRKKDVLNLEDFSKTVQLHFNHSYIAPFQSWEATFNDISNNLTDRILIIIDELRKVAGNLYLSTDDGSEGHKGFVTDPLREMLEKGEKIDLVLAIGPVIMMKNVAATTKPFGTKTTVSLNTIMVDGTGMCGGCRVMVGNENKFACVDGPEFDGHLVDFANLMQRQMMYKDQESIEYSCGGHCKCVEE